MSQSQVEDDRDGPVTNLVQPLMLIMLGIVVGFSWGRTSKSNDYALISNDGTIIGRIARY
jgi:hypothetical protein